jgi:hypothetical protein
MTLLEAKSIAHHLGLTLYLLRSGKYRVNLETNALEMITAHAPYEAQQFGRTTC